MGVRSIEWWLDIQEYQAGNLYNSFSAGPIARSWDDDDITPGSRKFMTIQDLVDEINELFLESWDNGDGDTENLYEVIPMLVPTAETYSGTGRGQVTIRFKFVRKYPLFAPEVASNKQFKIDLRYGPHGAWRLQPSLGGKPAAIITYTNEESIQGITVPYWAGNTLITDKPPIAPDMVFVPFLGVSNKILILLDGNMGDLDLSPVIIKDTDVTFLSQELYSQLKLSVQEAEVRSYLGNNAVELNYKSDDPIATYQLFRSTRRPRSYADFNTPQNPIVTLTERIAPNKPSAMATFISTLRPNVKYYFCARGIDIHGNISNPTEVFQIEMVDNQGQIFYTSKVIDMGKTPPENCTSGKRRYLHLAPALQQSVFNREAFMNSNEVQNAPQDIKITDLPPSNVLGYVSDDGESVWDKTFKIRVTSSKTGKKFDLNITVKNSGVNNP